MTRTRRPFDFTKLDDLLAAYPNVGALIMNRATLRKFIGLAGKKTKIVKKQRVYITPAPVREVAIRVDQRIPEDEVFGETERLPTG